MTRTPFQAVIFCTEQSRRSCKHRSVAIHCLAGIPEGVADFFEVTPSAGSSKAVQEGLQISRHTAQGVFAALQAYMHALYHMRTTAEAYFA